MQGCRHGARAAFLLALLLGPEAIGQPWTGLLDPTRAIDWSHAGGMASIRSDLQAISDRLFSEGEYSTGAS